MGNLFFFVMFTGGPRKKTLAIRCRLLYNRPWNKYADVMELVDVTDSKSVGGNIVWVRVPPSAPNRKPLNLNGLRAFSFIINAFPHLQQLRL